MIKIYVSLILIGKRSFDSIPEKLKDAVKLELNSRGFDENGKTI